MILVFGVGAGSLQAQKPQWEDRVVEAQNPLAVGAGISLLQQDWYERCWTVSFQEVEKDVFLVYGGNDAKVSLIDSNRLFSEEEMTRCFLNNRRGRDVYDFVFYGQTVLPVGNKNSAQFLRAMNASPGTGVERRDRSFMFGSKGRVMGAGNSFFSIVNPITELNNMHFDMFNHEFSHSKCCFAGAQHYDYLNEFGDGLGHWSHYLGRNAREESGLDNCSTMRASPYVEIGNGEAATRNCHNQTRPVFSDWEMYLWGFRNADAMKSRQFPSVSSKGVSVSYDIYRSRIEKWLTVEDLIKKMDGEIVWPSAEISQKHFRVAFILVIVPGTDSSQFQAVVEQWKRFAKLAPERWKEATHGVSTINDPTKPKPSLLVEKDYLSKQDFSYHPREWLVLQITGAVPNQVGTLVGFDGKNQYFLSIKTDAMGRATFSAQLVKDHIGVWSAIVHFGGDISSNALTFRVEPVWLY